MTNPIPQWCNDIPKVELHLHLEGAIPLPALWQLMQKYGGDPEVPTPAALAQQFTYRDFPHFIQTWIWKNQYIRELEDFTFIAEAVARDLASQNIRYVEAFFSPGDFARHGLIAQEIAAAIRAGLKRVPGVRVRLIADVIRDTGPDTEKALATLAAMTEVRDQDVIGIGLGGSEQDFPAELFTPVFEEARRRGFHTTAHAGEAAGPESVRAALEVLHVERIGHGVRAIEDPELVRTLATRHTPLEVCPISNICTNVYPSIREHPVRKLFERGVNVTLNTDDPKMFGNSLALEYATLVEELGFTRADIQQTLVNAIQASWLTESEKASLAAEFSREPAWQ
jgi:adenosine deaminase